MFNSEDYYHLSEKEIVEHFLPVKDLSSSDIDSWQANPLYQHFLPILLKNKDVRFFDYIKLLSYHPSKIASVINHAESANWIFGENWKLLSDDLKICGLSCFVGLDENIALKLTEWFVDNYKEIRPQIESLYGSVIFCDYSDELRSSERFKKVVSNFIESNNSFNADQVIESSGLLQNESALKTQYDAAIAWLKKDSSILDSVPLSSNLFSLHTDIFIRRTVPEYCNWLRQYFASRYLVESEKYRYVPLLDELLVVFLDDEILLSTREFVDKKAAISQAVANFSKTKIEKLTYILEYDEWDKLLKMFPGIQQLALEVFVKEVAYIPPALYHLLLEDAAKYIDDESQFAYLLLDRSDLREHSLWMRYKLHFKQIPKYEQELLTEEAKGLFEKHFGLQDVSVSPEQIFSFLKVVAIEKLIEDSSANKVESET